MKITKLELKNFKRFDDLTIDLTSLTEPAKLVLLIGTNGSGKSSIFDAFEYANSFLREKIFSLNDYSESPYLKKNANKPFETDIYFDGGIAFLTRTLAENNFKFMPNSFYGRTSLRQIPKLTRTSPGQIDISFEKDSDRPKTFIDFDNRFENDIEKIASSIFKDLYKENSSRQQILESYINPINKSFENIFGSNESTSLKLLSLIPPLDGKIAEILFEKGNSKIPYDYLSSGEKEIFNILLNLLTRREYFTNTIYFLDEIDLHLNTFLQKNLIKEITENWIPENCQLWTASHSLGFIEYANETKNASIIDFDNLNFDIPQVIIPSQKNNFDVFEIAVSKEFLSKVFEGKKIIFTENLDTPLYNNLNITDTIFFNAQNKGDVFHKAKNNPSYNGLIDRDYLTNEERLELLEVYKNLYILDYYSIENYLFHPENLEEYYGRIDNEFNKDSYTKSIIDEKDLIINKILIGFGIARDSYPFYRENENILKLKSIRSNNSIILKMLESNDFETFYKVFPAKVYGTQLRERQNINKVNLSKTVWFKSKIEEVLKK